MGDTLFFREREREREFREWPFSRLLLSFTFQSLDVYASLDAVVPKVLVKRSTRTTIWSDLRPASSNIHLSRKLCDCSMNKKRFSQSLFRVAVQSRRSPNRIMYARLFYHSNHFLLAQETSAHPIK